ARKDQKPGPFSPMNLQGCSQLWFDPILRSRAESFACVQILYRHRLEFFDADGDGVTARVENLESGEELTFRAEYMAGCDGAASTIRRGLGIQDLGTHVLSSALHVFFRAPRVFEKMGVEPAVFFAAVDQSGYWGNIRIVDPADGLWRILFDVPPGFDPQSLDYARCLRRSFAKEIDVEWVGASKWTRRGVVAEKYSVDRVYLAGDSVHQVSPTGALGMNTGIGDAVDLGWKIAARYHGWGGAGLLGSYSLERQPVGARNVDMSTKYYEGQAQFRDGLDGVEDPTPHGDEVRAAVAASVLAHVTRMFATLGLQIGYRYEKSPICVPDDTPPGADDPATYQPSTRAGSRAPHVRLADGRSTLDLFGRGFVLLRLGDAYSGGEAIEAEARRQGVPLRTHAFGDPELARIYEKTFVLVRPDGHVAWRGDEMPADMYALIARVRGSASSR
ncbi:MAG TPA: FAD-dependent monooxygenase, partial [Candidatus Baltobacteraceae bacterium]|nr:FAD-dependent monooxygenase [Candidatus Baltobacteraceae bacterium]